MKYIKPEIKICIFSAEDIITASGDMNAAANDIFEAAKVDVNYSQAVNVGAIIGGAQE